MGLKSIALTTRPRMLVYLPRGTPWPVVRTYPTPTQKKSDTFSICACHPCAGAMLIFSVSFQFYRMRRVLPRSRKKGRCTPSVPTKKKRKEKKRKEKIQKVISQREARTLNLPVNSRARCQLRHPGKDNFVSLEVNTNTSSLCKVRGLGRARPPPAPLCTQCFEPRPGKEENHSKRKKKKESPYRDSNPESPAP